MIQATQPGPQAATSAKTSFWRNLSIVQIALLLLCLILPFFEVRCSGNTVAQFSGADIAFGKKLESAHPAQYAVVSGQQIETAEAQAAQSTPPDVPFLLLLAVFIGAASYTVKDKGGVRMAVGATGVIALFWYRSHATVEAQEQVGLGGIITLEPLAGYWLMLIDFTGMALAGYFCRHCHGRSPLASGAINLPGCSISINPAAGDPPRHNQAATEALRDAPAIPSSVADLSEPHVPPGPSLGEAIQKKITGIGEFSTKHRVKIGVVALAAALLTAAVVVPWRRVLAIPPSYTLMKARFESYLVSLDQHDARFERSDYQFTKISNGDGVFQYEAAVVYALNEDLFVPAKDASIGKVTGLSNEELSYISKTPTLLAKNASKGTTTAVKGAFRARLGKNGDWSFDSFSASLNELPNGASVASFGPGAVVVGSPKFDSTIALFRTEALKTIAAAKAEQAAKESAERERLAALDAKRMREMAAFAVGASYEGTLLGNNGPLPIKLVFESVEHNGGLITAFIYHGNYPWSRKRLVGRAIMGENGRFRLEFTSQPYGGTVVNRYRNEGYAFFDSTARATLDFHGDVESGLKCDTPWLSLDTPSPDKYIATADWSDARKALMKKAVNGDSSAALNLAKDFGNGKNGKPDAIEEMAWLEWAGSLGNPDAYCSLATRFITGEAVWKNEEVAIALLQDIADRSPAAMCTLGKAAYNGWWGVPQDKFRAYRSFRDAANKNYRPALSLLGLMVFTGEGVDRNEEEGARFIKRAADLGDKEAASTYAKLVYLGFKGHAPNDAEAARYRQLAGDNSAPPPTSAPQPQQEQVRQPVEPSSEPAPSASAGNEANSGRTALTIDLPVNQKWVDTGVDLRSGQVVVFTAEGQASLASIIPFMNMPSGPMGLDNFDTRQSTIKYIAPGLKACALVGKVGSDGEPFQIGTGYTMQNRIEGRLYLAPNNFKWTSSTGTWQVAISVDGYGPRQSAKL